MQIRSVVVVAALGLASFAHGQQAVQWRVEDGGNGHWYRRVDAPLSWTAARDACVQRGGYLATPTSAAENAVVYGVNQGNCWLGGFQPPDTCEPNCQWQWVTGEPWVYTNWDPAHEPDDAWAGQDHLIYWTGDRWGDIEGYLTSVYICEWSADCNGDGLVDYGQILDGTFDDVNSNGVPDCCDAGESCRPCPGDITGGGQVNGVDLAAILGAWGTDGQGKLDCDINDDGTVDATDLSVVLAGWGTCP